MMVASASNAQMRFIHKRDDEYCRLNDKCNVSMQCNKSINSPIANAINYKLHKHHKGEVDLQKALKISDKNSKTDGKKSKSLLAIVFSTIRLLCR